MDKLEYYALKNQWKFNTGHMSNPNDIMADESYQKLIQDGSILTMLINDMRKGTGEGFHFYDYLTKILGVDPTKEEHCGMPIELDRDWLEWIDRHPELIYGE